MYNWFNPPDVRYSIKHNFAWPGPGHAMPPPPVSGAGAAGVAEAAAAGAASGAAAGGGGMGMGPGGVGHGFGYRGYHGYYPYHRRRFGFGRRLIWFGLGVGAATWYIRHKERERQGVYLSNNHCSPWGRESVPPVNPGLDANAAAQASAPPSYPSWKTLHQKHHYEPIPPVPASTQPTVNQPQSQILAQLPPPAAPAAQAVPLPPSSPVAPASIEDDLSPNQVDGRRLTWRAKREQRRLEREAQVRAKEAQAQAQAQAQRSTEEEKEALPAQRRHASVELQEIKEVVEGLWAEKKKAAVEMQEKANERAREYASEKLETLSKALDTLRESLKAEEAKRAEEKKLV